MRIRSYTVDDTSKITAAWLNNITDDFSNAMTEAYLELEALRKRNIAFKSAVRDGMSFLAQRANAINGTQTGLGITAYNQPVSYSSVQLDHTYGQVTLEESDRVTHFPTAEDNFGRDLAIASVGVYTGATETSFSANTSARAIVDAEQEIWSQDFAPAATDSGSLWLRIVTPVIGQTPNFVSVYPLAGTEVETIKLKRTTGYTTFTPASVWPVKLHQNFSDYDRELRIKLKGVLQPSGNYRFTLQKVDLYSVRYASQGTVTWRTPDAFSSVESVTLNNPWHYPIASQVTDAVQLKVYTADGLTTLYDSFVETSPFTVPGDGEQLLVQATLYRKAGTTPFVRTVT